MAHDNGIITAPISLVDDVEAVIGTAGHDLGSICQKNTINMWAKYRPTAGGRIQDRLKSDGTEEYTEKMYGFQTGTFNLSNIPILKPENQSSTVNGDFRPNLQWPNILPTLTYYRLTDFENYWHAATPPFACYYYNTKLNGNVVFEMRTDDIDYKNYILNFEDIIGTRGGGSSSVLAQLRIGLAIIDVNMYNKGAPETTFARSFIFPITMQDVFFTGKSGVFTDYTTNSILAYGRNYLSFSLNFNTLNSVILAGSGFSYTLGDIIKVRPILANIATDTFYTQPSFANCYSFELKSGFATGQIMLTSNPTIITKTINGNSGLHITNNTKLEYQSQVTIGGVNYDKFVLNKGGAYIFFGFNNVSITFGDDATQTRYFGFSSDLSVKNDSGVIPMVQFGINDTIHYPSSSLTTDIECVDCYKQFLWRDYGNEGNPAKYYNKPTSGTKTYYEDSVYLSLKGTKADGMKVAESDENRFYFYFPSSADLNQMYIKFYFYFGGQEFTTKIDADRKTNG